MQEQVVTFGDNRALVGILTAPAATPAKQLPTIVLLNAGMVHRIGPFRINTQLARTLVEHGFTSLRFDLSGIGDSQLNADSNAYEQQVMQDIGAAITFLKADRNCKNFVLVGLCSGADNAHKAAVANAEVDGAVFIDGYIYPTRKFLFNRYMPVLLNPKLMLNVLIHRAGVLAFGKLKRDRFDHLKQPESDPDNQFVWRLPPKAKTARELKHLVERNTSLCYIYTGGYARSYNYNHQFRQCFAAIKFGELLTEHYFADIDHTNILTADRNLVIQAILNWLRNQFDIATEND